MLQLDDASMGARYREARFVSQLIARPLPCQFKIFHFYHFDDKDNAIVDGFIT